MAGKRDTPKAKKARDDAAKGEPAEGGSDHVPATDVEVLVAAGPPVRRRVYGRRVPTGESSSMVASAARIDMHDRRSIENTRRRRQAWQTEAWDYYDEVGESGYTIDFGGNLLSKVRLFAAVRPDPNEAPVPVDAKESGVDPTTAKICMDALERLRSSEGGQSALVREMTLNFDVAGEALDVDTLVATPTGLVRIGDLKDGDVVLGGDGRPCRVVIAHPIREDRDCYEVRLTGDIRVVADGAHLWTTHTQRDRQYARQWGRDYEPSVLTTLAMAESLKWEGGAGKAANHAIELSSVEGADPVLGAEIDPYVLGYWLGDGTSTQGNITAHPDDQPHLREQVEAAGYGWSPRPGDPRGFQVGILGLQAQLRRAGLLGDKHVPPAYLRHTEAARWALLQGLIDSDGHVDKAGLVEFSNINIRLLWDVAELASSLGLRASRPSRHRVWFNSAGKPVARLPRKAERIAPAKERDRWRYVQSVEQVKSRPVRCITVDSPDRTFLVTQHMVRTHNCYLHGHEDPETGEEDWQIRSVDELVVTGDSFALRTALGTNITEPIPVDDLVVRLWQRHPRFSQLATCAMRRVLGEAESLLLLSREIRATSKSRLSAGLLLVPSEISFGPADPTRSSQDGESTDDPFEESLQEAMTTPIQQEGSASAVVPLVVRAPAELLAAIRLVELQKSLDPTLDKRIEGRVLRIARGLNMPVEVTTGLQETTFANAAQVKKSEWDAHGEPRAVLMCDALTAGYFQPAIEEAGVPADKVRDFFIWFDPSDAISAPDPVDHVEKAHEDGLISDATRRRVQGYSEDDAPSDLELLRRVIFHSQRMDPFIFAQLLKLTGLVPDIQIPAPQSGILDDTGNIIVGAPPTGTPISPSKPIPETAPRVEQQKAIAAAAHRQGVPLGRRLMEIDRELRMRLHSAANSAMMRALERSGNRIRSKAGRTASGEYSAVRRIADGVTAARVASAVGPILVAAIGLTDEQLLQDSFNGLLGDMGTYVDMAQQQAIAAVEAVVGPLDASIREGLATNMVTGAEAAQAQLSRSMTDLAATRLYSPMPGATLGESDPSATVPMSMIRDVLAIAGGDTPRGGPVPGGTSTPLTSDMSGGPVGGVATGPDMMEALGSVGGGVEGYVWDYGPAMRNPFPPHEDLDGIEFVNFDDPILANDEDFPDLPYYMPGDHDGCACDVTPTIVFVSQTGDVTAEGEGEAAAAPPEEQAAVAEPDSAGAMLDALREKGGFTIDPATGTEATSGYAVAIPDHSGITSADAFFAGDPGHEAGRDIIDQWLADNASVLDQEGMHVGGWWDMEHNEIVLDPSHVLADMNEAIAEGIANDQQAIFDIANGVEIPTGGTGQRVEAVAEDVVSHSTTEGLAAAIDSGITSSEDLNGIGSSAMSVDRVVFGDGTQAIVKTVLEPDEAAMEVLASRVADAIGANVPAAILDPANEPGTAMSVVEGFVNGQTGQQWASDLHDAGLTLDDIERRVASDFASTESGQRLGLLDDLIANEDRNFGNWIIQPDGTIAGIDHGAAFIGVDAASIETPDDILMASASSPFATQEYPLDLLEQVQPALEALESTFQSMDAQGWYNGMVDRFNYLKAEAVKRETPPVAATVEDSLAAAMRSGIASSRELDGGAMALSVERVTFADGVEAVVKVVDDSAVADMEVLASKVGRAIGADVPAVIANGTTLTEEFVPGTVGFNWMPLQTDQALLDLAASPSGQRLGLLDDLIANSDRNAGNYIIRPDGSVAGIDHGFAFRVLEPSALYPPDHILEGSFYSPFSARSYSRDLLDQVKPSLDALRPTFESMNRMDWYEGMMERFDYLKSVATA